LGHETKYAEVEFYFLIEDDNNDLSAHALVSVYGPPDQDLLEDSYHTLHAFSQHAELMIVAVTSIISVVSMQPLPEFANQEEPRYFVVEKSGIDDNELTGYVDLLDEAGVENNGEV
jgi:hypothetical protein